MSTTQLVSRYAAGATLPKDSIEGLSTADLLAFPVPGTWSIQQVILHLMDSDLIGADRMKRVISESNPLILAYDESAFARSLFYHDMDAAAACEVFAGNRAMMAEVLRRLPETAWSRTGIHSERGKLTLEDLVKGYCDHLDHHLRFIEDKKRALRR
jgi:hypothetical protein